MSIAKVAVVPVLLAALGAARGADVDPIRPLIHVTWETWDPDRRDPLEYCTPEEAFPPPPPNAAELARQAEERFALGDLSGAEGFADKAFEALRLQSAGDLEVVVRLRGLREKIGGMRTEVDAAKEFRKLNLRLSGVAWNKSNPVAFVNDKLCVPGDIVEGATIDLILPGEVIFEFNGVRMRKSLLRPSVERVEGSDEPGERE